ncbi:AHH domain-containing protein [Pyxidicoccus sp. 3LG]
MPNQFDGANVALKKGPDGEKEEPKNPCGWLDCKGHVKDIKKDYKKGNVERQAQKIRHNLFAKHKDPWDEGGHGETNIREMYLDNRQDGVITIKTKKYPYLTQAHHLIPVESVKNLPKLKKNAPLAGWDINHINNGILLPEKEMDVALHLLQQHYTNHPKYSEKVELLLKKIDKAFKTACQDQEDVTRQLGLLNALNDVSLMARNKIIAIRQHAAGVDFWPIRDDSKEVYVTAVSTWKERQDKYMEQQRAAIIARTQQGKNT